MSIKTVKFSRIVLDEYRQAVRDSDWAVQAGILMALLRNIVRHKGTDAAEISVATADEIVKLHDLKGRE